MINYQYYFYETALCARKHGINFIIYGYMNCSTVENNIGHKIYNLYDYCMKHNCMDIFKQGMNIFIGKLQSTNIKEKVMKDK